MGKVCGFFLFFRDVLGVDESVSCFEEQCTPRSVSSSSGLDPVIMLFVPTSTGGDGFWLVGCSRLSHDPALSGSVVPSSSLLGSDETIPIRSTNAISCPLSLSIFTTLFTSHPTCKREHKRWSYALKLSLPLVFAGFNLVGGGTRGELPPQTSPKLSPKNYLNDL